MKIRFLTLFLLLGTPTVPSIQALTQFSTLVEACFNRKECIFPYDFFRLHNDYFKLHPEQQYPLLESWAKGTCPESIIPLILLPQPIFSPLISQNEFVKIAKEFIRKSTEERPADAKSTKIKDALVLQKIAISPDKKLIVFGDLHGTLHSFLRSLPNYLSDENFKLKDGYVFLFTGDLTDRCSYGTEVLYVWMRLKLANWDHVYLTRGNHENIEMNRLWGLSTEWWHKYSNELPKWLSMLYNQLPLGLVVQYGHNRIFVSHAGLPTTISHDFLNNPYSPSFLKIGEQNFTFEYETKYEAECNDIIKRLTWSDIGLENIGRPAHIEEYRPLISVKTASDFLNAHEFTLWLRGHQHYDCGLKMFRPKIPALMPEETPINDPIPWKSVVTKEDQDNPQGFLTEHYLPILTCSSGAGTLNINEDSHIILQHDEENKLRLLVYEKLGTWDCTKNISCWVPLKPEPIVIAPAPDTDKAFYTDLLISYPQESRAAIIGFWLQEAKTEEDLELFQSLITHPHAKITEKAQETLSTFTKETQEKLIGVPRKKQRILKRNPLREESPPKALY